MRTTIILAALVAAFPTAAIAQDVVVMRRQLAPPNRKAVPPSGGGQAGGPAETYRWQPTGSYGPWNSTCSAEATRPILYDCTRVSDGAAVTSERCSGLPRTERTEPVSLYDGCTYTKVLGAPGPYSTTCGAGATRTTVNSCSRDLDLVRVDPQTFCSIPATVTDTADVYTGCTGVWRTSTEACGADDVRLTTTACMDASGAPASGTCDPTKRPADVRNACAGTWDSYQAACSSTGVHEQVVRCLDSTGTRIDDSNCNPSRKPSTATTSCTGTWKSTPGTCTGTQTPVVTCQKDGANVADGFCNPSQKPPSTPQACVVPATSCGTMVQQWFGPAGGASINIGTANSVTDARTTCVSKLGQYGAGTCGWNSNQKIVYYWQGVKAVNRGTVSTDHLWGASCQ